MKKFIILLNDHLSHFWFTILLLTLGGFIIAFLDPWGGAKILESTEKLNQISSIVGRFWTLFLLPLSIVSIAISLYIWLKDKTENNYRGLSAFIITITTIASVFLFMVKLSTLISTINSNHFFNASINKSSHAPMIGGPGNTQNIQ